MDTLTARACAAWFRSGGSDPPSDDSGTVTHKQLTYVVLRNTNGVMAIYRVTNRGELRRLKRWPSELEVTP
jgi:hypothetical protein